MHPRYLSFLSPQHGPGPVGRDRLSSQVLSVPLGRLDKLWRQAQGRARRGHCLMTPRFVPVAPRVAHIDGDATLDNRRSISRDMAACRRDPLCSNPGAREVGNGILGRGSKINAAGCIMSSTNNMLKYARGVHQLALRNSDMLARGGAGGRSSVSGVTAAVFGSSGFVGRYVAQALGSMGVRLVLPYRCDETDVQHLRTMGDLGMVVMQENFDMRDRDSVKRAVEGVDLVINVLGADHETWNYTFDDVHVKWAETLARACEDARVERVLHFSALGAGEDAPSRRLRTKHRGDEILKEGLGDKTTIMKPAPITGPEDRVFRRFASLIKKMPFVPLIDGGRQKVAPIWIRDVAQCVNNALETYESMGKEYELVGPDVFTMKELAAFSFNTIRERPTMVPINMQAAKLLAAPGDILATKSPVRLRFAGWSQDSVEETQLDLLQSPGSLSAADLGVDVHKVTEGLPIEYLRHYRSGGYDLGSVGTEGSAKFTAPPHCG